MATVSTALKMFDQMTIPLQQVTQALNLTIGAMDSLANSANSDIKLTNTLNSARTAIQNANAGLNQLVNSQNNAANSQNKLNNEFNKGINSSNGLLTKVRGLMGAYVGLQALRGGISATDNYINQGSRLALINDGLQSQVELQNKIFQAAQRSRGIYGEMVSSVAKLGLLAKDAFSNNSEVINFAELMNKSFKVSGASISEASNGMYQLTQAMAAGRLQGDEFRSVMENAPMLAQAIATYTGKTIGELRDMSSEGLITADIIKNALFTAADDINAKFQTMPKTFSSVWTTIKNDATVQFSQIMKNVNSFINTDNGVAAIQGITNSIGVLAMVVGFTLNGIMSVSSFFTNNWSMIEPIIWGIVGAIAAYNVAVGIMNLTSAVSKGLELAGAIAKAIHTKATLAKTSATAAETAAQWGLNSAILACPITWIILGIILLITIFYAAVAAVNHFAGTSISATGLVAGAFMTALAFIGNLFVGAGNLIIDVISIIWNFIAAFAEFFANVFSDPVGSIVRLFASMADTVLGILEGIASAIDTLFGSKLAGAVSGWRTSLSGMVTNLVGEAQVKIPRMDSSSLHLERFSYGSAFNVGNNFGKNVDEKFNLNKILDGINAKDLNSFGEFGNLENGLSDANKNLKNIDDKMDVSNEHLELLRDLAEQESIQNFVTLTPTVQVKTGDIRETADFDMIISKIESYMENELVNSAEGVYT